MQAEMTDIYRAALQSAADLMKASLQQTERLQQRQLEILREAVQNTEQSSTEIAGTKNIDEVFRVNRRIVGDQFEAMTQFWSSVWSAAAETQKRFAEQVQAQAGRARDRMREGYDFTARTSEEAARVAAVQMTDATNAMRDATTQERHTQGTAHGHERKGEARKTG
jgi:hypothetical protein